MMRESSSEPCPQVVLDWIAWYPEGDLPQDVRSAIELHAAECAACRQEITELTGPGEADASAAAGAERVFARALEKIEARPRLAASPAARRRFWIVRPRLAVAACVVVAFTSASAGVVATQQLRRELAASYEPATRAVNLHDAAGGHLEVVFRADASFGEIAQAIAAIGASVESGPTPSGVVQLHLVPGVDAAAAARRLESGDLAVAEFAQPAP
jgi:hypothetical protein